MRVEWGIVVWRLRVNLWSIMKQARDSWVISRHTLNCRVGEQYRDGASARDVFYKVELRNSADSITVYSVPCSLTCGRSQ